MQNADKTDSFPTLKNKSPWNYFENRIRNAAELKRLLPLQPAEHKELIAELNNPAQSEKRCIYIHIPFCTKSCSFCGYYKCINPEKQTVEKYIESLKQQIEKLSATPWVKDAYFNAMYFGGGTPTSLPFHLFSDLLNTFTENLPLTADCEITLESTINELDDDYLKLMPLCRVNRVSLGVQSFHEKIRKQYTRQANYNDIATKIEEIKKTGIENCCVDLIYNLEGLTMETWQRDLEFVKETKITGCSVYPLLPFPNAPLVKNSNFPKPKPETEFSYFKLADDFLTSIPNWEAITAVQYGHKKQGNARYVKMQADDSDVLALGPGAGGKINGLQYINAFSLADFLEDISFPAEKTRIFGWQDGKESLAEKLKFFRKTFLPENEFEKTFKNEKRFAGFLYENELINREDSKIKLTQTGKYWAANLAGLIF